MKTYLPHILLVLTLCSAMGLPEADRMPLRVSDQMPLFLKILSYDKNLPARGDEVVIGVVYQERFRASLLAKADVLDVMQQYQAVAGHTIRMVPLAIDDPAGLSNALARHGVNVLYITPLRAFDLEAITMESRTRQIITLTGVPAYLDDGLSISLDVRKGRPQILINLPATEAEGANFHSQLLRLAKVIR